MSIQEDRDVITVQHPLPALTTLELDNGDTRFSNHDQDGEWIQADESHCLELDGRWR